MEESQDQLGRGEEVGIEGEETGDRRPSEGTAAAVWAKVTKTCYKTTVSTERRGQI